MSSLSYSDSTFCGAGAEGKIGEALVEHFRKFVGDAWESASPPGLALVLRPTVFETATAWCMAVTGKSKLPKSEQKIVYFLTTEQMKRVYPEHNIVSLGVLVKQMEGGVKFLGVTATLTKAALMKWFAVLRQKWEECVVCYEETGPGRKLSRACAICAANMCVQCSIDIALGAKHVEHMRAPRCPLCAVQYLGTFSKLCADAVTDKTLSEAHKEFAHFWNDFEHSHYSRALRRDFAKMTAKMRDAIELDFEIHLRGALKMFERKLRESRTKENRWVHRRCVEKVKSDLETFLPRLQRALRECDAVKVKTPLKSSGDDSIATAAAAVSAKPKPVRVRSDRCARCQKVFWTKKEKKRAPKCPKCKRVVYCSNACRKKHKATHSLQCPNGAVAKKRKKDAAKAAKLYGR